jgi:hypothetical protein
MPRLDRTRERIQTLEERLARLRASRSRLLERASQTERRRDTRRKIIIGGTVLAAVDSEGVPALKTKAQLVDWLESRLQRPADRAAFEFDDRTA